MLLSPLFPDDIPLLDFVTILIWLKLASVYLIGGIYYPANIWLAKKGIKHDEMCINITIL